MMSENQNRQNARSDKLWNLAAVLIGAVITLIAGLLTTDKQAAATSNQARTDFVRSQRQVVYSAFVADEHALVQLEADFLVVEHLHDKPDSEQLMVRGHMVVNIGDPVKYSDAFSIDQLAHMKDQSRKIGDAYHKLEADYSALILIGLKETSDDAKNLINWHTQARASHFDNVLNVQAGDTYVTATRPQDGDRAYHNSNNVGYNPEQSDTETLRTNFIGACQRDLYT